MNSDNLPNSNPKQEKQSNISPFLSTAPVGAQLQKDADPNASAYLSPSYIHCNRWGHRRHCGASCGGHFNSVHPYYGTTETVTTKEVDETGNTIIRTISKPVVSKTEKIVTGIFVAIFTIVFISVFVFIGAKVVSSLIKN
ncbi:hypothetical protein NEHOM01_0169 [Nematocida homosporus]|uniref:uncharacterized protein n=1 Tax=Nematocida homosporus TaxID=1912981 RepID=UPI002220A36E|nr:uncharacterized protein NEHOM01_0169 [Nematocida homosporus]KAI5184424.1 hypothetical protein NEHOM01_0169 [Nematocida homosporus]